MRPNHLEPDYSYWIRMDQWSCDEGSFLLAGLDPRSVRFEQIDLREARSKHAMDIRRLAVSSISSGSLSDSASPKEFLEWARSKSLDIPSELKALESDAPPDPRSDVSVRQSGYWCALEDKLTSAIEQFPRWRAGQRKVQMSKNLDEWLRNSIGLSSREAEIAKKVLSEIHKNLL